MPPITGVGRLYGVRPNHALDDRRSVVLSAHFSQLLLLLDQSALARKTVDKNHRSILDTAKRQLHGAPQVVLKGDDRGLSVRYGATTTAAATAEQGLDVHFFVVGCGEPGARLVALNEVCRWRHWRRGAWLQHGCSLNFVFLFGCCPKRKGHCPSERTNWCEGHF
jgi:hypothetical protein